MNAERVKLAAAVLRDMDREPPPFGDLVTMLGPIHGEVHAIASPALWLAQDERLIGAGLQFDSDTDPFKALGKFFGLRPILMQVLFGADRGHIEEKSITLSRFARDLEYTAEHEIVPPYMLALYSVDVFPEHFDEVKRDYEAGLIGANQYEELPDL